MALSWPAIFSLRSDADPPTLAGNLSVLRGSDADPETLTWNVCCLLGVRTGADAQAALELGRPGRDRHVWRRDPARRRLGL
eukprot:2500074-Rhodomonas_salina.4